MLVFLLGLLLIFVSAFITNFQIFLVLQNNESLKWSTPNLSPHMPCCHLEMWWNTIFQEPTYCVVAETLLPPCPTYLFLLILLPWSSLWKLISVLFLPCTKHWACCLFPSVYRKPVQIYSSSCGVSLSTQLCESFLY